VASTPDWKSWIGVERTSIQTIDVVRCHEMQATLDRQPLLADGDVLPAAWHWLYFRDVARMSDLGQDGHPRLGIFMPPLNLARRMWAGGEIEFHEPILIGRSAERTTRIASIEEKLGRTGRLMFVKIEHRITQEGRVCVTERQDVVYRDPPAIPASTSASSNEPLTAVDFQDDWVIDSTLLFRYSALTFNGHRIHYDADYARDVEGYSGIVVHGPLIATLMLDLVVSNGGRCDVFSYRALQPAVAPVQLSTYARHVGHRTELWATDARGSILMSAFSSRFRPT
jgi:3-methylfumaryl-CoA hydratase